VTLEAMVLREGELFSSDVIVPFMQRLRAAT
jgi:hypothetical protein